MSDVKEAASRFIELYERQAALRDELANVQNEMDDLLQTPAIRALAEALIPAIAVPAVPEVPKRKRRSDADRPRGPRAAAEPTMAEEVAAVVAKDEAA